MIKQMYAVDEVVLGGLKDPYKIIEKIKPAVICLGYDQESFVPGLEEELKKRKVRAKVVRLKGYREERYKSSKLREE
jgi:FAD synthetase